MITVIDPETPLNYADDWPLAGERIGPAWRAAWRLMADGEWHSQADLVPAMIAAGPIAKVTAANMLRAARRAKVLATRRTTREDGGAGPSDYRITA